MKRRDKKSENEDEKEERSCVRSVLLRPPTSDVMMMKGGLTKIHGCRYTRENKDVNDGCGRKASIAKCR